MLTPRCFRACAIVSLVLVTLTPAFAVGPFEAVPTDHWACGAMQELIKHGVNPANAAFKLTASSTRYDYAKFLAATLEDRVFSVGQSASGGNSPTPTGIAEADLDSLLKLNGEFKDELTAMGVDLDAAKREITGRLKVYRKNTGEGRLRMIKQLVVIQPDPAPQTSALAVEDWSKDITASGRLTRSDEHKEIGLVWNDLHYVSRVILQYPACAQPPDPSGVRLQYWKIDRPPHIVQFSFPGSSLVDKDDFCFAGEWCDADVYVDCGVDVKDFVRPVTCLPGIFRSSSSGKVGAQKPFVDVPSGHWAYKAIDLLVEHGLIIGYPPGTFAKGTMTRFEFGQAMARAWPKVESDILKKPADRGLVRSDIETLAKLVNEFEDVFAPMGMNVDKMRIQLAELSAPFVQMTKERNVCRVSYAPSDVWTLTFRPSNAELEAEAADQPISVLTSKVRIIFPDAVSPGTRMRATGRSVLRR